MQDRMSYHYGFNFDESLKAAPWLLIATILPAWIEKEDHQHQIIALFDHWDFSQLSPYSWMALIFCMLLCVQVILALFGFLQSKRVEQKILLNESSITLAHNILKPRMIELDYQNIDDIKLKRSVISVLDILSRRNKKIIEVQSREQIYKISSTSFKEDKHFEDFCHELMRRTGKNITSSHKDLSAF